MSKQFSISGFDRTIFSLKDERGTFFIFLRSLAQTFGPKKDIASVPHVTASGFLQVPCKFLDCYYVSIISDCFLVRSVTIHHILQSSEKRNIFGSIWHVSCFHLERYYKMIKIVYYVIHINFPIKSTDSCWKLRRGQNETSRKVY